MVQGHHRKARARHRCGFDSSARDEVCLPRANQLARSLIRPTSGLQIPQIGGDDTGEDPSDEAKQSAQPDAEPEFAHAPIVVGSAWPSRRSPPPSLERPGLRRAWTLWATLR